MNCLFCRIINGELDSDIVYQDDQVLAFSDINPQAPEHKLIIPRKHIETINDVAQEDERLVGHMITVGQQIAMDLNIDQDGYRLVFNCNRGAGQEVYHIHLHLLGGRQMHWPPG